MLEYQWHGHSENAAAHAGGKHGCVNLFFFCHTIAQTILLYSSKIVFSAFFKGALVSRPGVHSLHPLGDMRPGFADDPPGY